MRPTRRSPPATRCLTRAATTSPASWTAIPCETSTSAPAMISFRSYKEAVELVRQHLREATPQADGERDAAYSLRLRREATDACRFLLPASTLTNVGVTMNARSMEHAIRKLLSSDLSEERELGEELKAEGQADHADAHPIRRPQRVHGCYQGIADGEVGRRRPARGLRRLQRRACPLRSAGGV